LSKYFDAPILGAVAETDADSVVSGKVDNEYLPSVCKNGAAITRMSKVDNLTEALEGYWLEKPARPDLE
jgi:hypothetical protein